MPLLYFTNEHALTLVQRSVYTGGKSAYSTVSGATGAIYMRTLNEEQAAVNGLQWGQAFSGVIDTAIDVQTGDRIIVDSVVYLVKGVTTNKRGRILDFKKLLLTKPAV